MQRLLIPTTAAAILTVSAVGVAFARGETNAPPQVTPTATATPSDDEPSAEAEAFGFGFSIQSGLDDNGAFLDTFAEKLGVTRDALDEAYHAAVLELIDQAVAEGDLGEKAAERLRESIGKGDIPFGMVFPLPLNVAPIQVPAFGIPPLDPSMPPKVAIAPFFGLGGEDSLDRVAEFLGITAADLKDELNAEATLAEAGEKHGKSRDELAAFLASVLEDRLDELEEEGELGWKTLEEMREHIDETIDGWLDARFRFGDHEFGMMSGDGAFEFAEGAVEPAVPSANVMPDTTH